MKTRITLLTLAVASLSAFAADITGTWKAEFETQRVSFLNVLVAITDWGNAITSEANLDIWGLTEVAITRWREMEVAAEEPGPYIYRVTRTGALAKIQL